MKYRAKVGLVSLLLGIVGVFFAGVGIGRFRAAFRASEFQVFTLSFVLNTMEEKDDLAEDAKGSTERLVRHLLLGDIAYLAHHERSFFVKDVVSKRTETLSRYIKQGELEFAKKNGYDFEAWRTRRTSESPLDWEKRRTIKAYNKAMDEILPGRGDLLKK